jgi:hypothetical protein
MIERTYLERHPLPLVYVLYLLQRLTTPTSLDTSSHTLIALHPAPLTLSSYSSLTDIQAGSTRREVVEGGGDPYYGHY